MSHFHYAAFGERLRSTLPLPELRAVDPGPVRWDFQVVERLPEARDRALIGEERIYGAVSARLFRHAAGHRIEIDDTGEYDLDAGNREIRWQPTAEPWWDFGRSHLLGRVLATSLQLGGVVTLHGSAVETHDGVVGFLAPKHFGKSTLSASLVRAGARFVTDDALAVRVDEPVVALPGIPSLRVRADEGTARHPLLDGPVPAPGRDGKIVLPPLPADRVMAAPRRLAALYLLHPRRADAPGPAAERRALPPVAAAVHLLGQSKVGAMLGSSFAPGLLDATTRIAGRVPTYGLAVVRDHDRLPEVVEILLEWHGRPDSGGSPRR